MGEADAISRFCKHGIPVYLPFGDNERADMLIEIADSFLKIQCKSSNSKDEDKTVFYLQTCSTNYLHTYTIEEIDYFYLYSVFHDAAMLIKNDGIMKSVAMRFNESKNNQTYNVKFYKDYDADKIIDELLNIHMNSNV